MSVEQLPSDVYFELFIYTDGETPQKLAHEMLAHKHGDSPDRITVVDPTSIGGVGTVSDVADRRRVFGEAPTLGEVRNRVGQRVSVRVRGNVLFEFSLEPWADADPDHTRVATSVIENYRLDAFTEEHHRLFQQQQAAFGARSGQQDDPHISP